ncbi:hypothetical protein [Streptomyces tremellae]|uniref:PPE family domain-containing protein n=1 Tax=Streptomyces tremellae TaxID=1124239 RepID=A0ABP7GBH9_9ACTN
MTAPGGETDFESMSHAEMVALLRSADARTAAGVSEKLASVAETVSKIGEHLKAHVRALEWEGEGGDAFREWGDQTANATLKLASYAGGAGRWMGHVSQTIVEAHANMPALSVTVGARSDLRDAARALADSGSPGWEKSAMLASSRIESARADAAVQMRRLASSYVQAGTEINKLKPPTFPPPANGLGNDWIDPHSEITRPGSSGTAPRFANSEGGREPATGGSHGGQFGAHQLIRGSSAFSHPSAPSATHSPAIGASHAPDSHMDIDSAVPTVSPTRTESPLGPPPHGLDLGGASPGVVPPAFGGAPGAAYGIGSRGSDFAKRPGVGSAGAGIPRVPNAGEAMAAGRGSTLPRENGIIGGRPVQSPSGRPPAGLPRGLVVGGEEGTNGAGGQRPMMGRGMPGMHMGGQGGFAAGRNGLVGGRRLASETGGAVGRPAQSGRLGESAFTRGGSGLVREGSARDQGTAGERPGQAGRAGAPPHGGSGSRRRKGDRSTERPDYLIEEEETWQQGDRRVVPPVID